MSEVRQRLENAGYNINLSCPPSEPATQGHSFDCLVGAGTVIKVTITDDQGNYTFVPVGANSGTGPPSWATSAPAPPTSASAPPTGTSAPGSRVVLDHTAVEQTIEKAGYTGVVCNGGQDPEVIVDATFPCTADGGKAITVTITSATGNYAWSPN
jgi:hypothetical protein